MKTSEERMRVEELNSLTREYLKNDDAVKNIRHMLRTMCHGKEFIPSIQVGNFTYTLKNPDELALLRKTLNAALGNIEREKNDILTKIYSLDRSGDDKNDENTKNISAGNLND